MKLWEWRAREFLPQEWLLVRASEAFEMLWRGLLRQVKRLEDGLAGRQRFADWLAVRLLASLFRERRERTLLDLARPSERLEARWLGLRIRLFMSLFKPWLLID